MRGADEKIAYNLDYSLLGIYFLLMILGVINIYSAGYDPDHSDLFDFSTEHGKQLMWFGISLFLGLAIMLIDSTFIRKYSIWFYGFTMFMLVAVLFTPPVNGARSWFGFGSVGIQPSEFAKIGVALALAGYLSQTNPAKRLNDQAALSLRRLSFAKMHWQTMVIIAVPCILVLLQPDAGTFIIFTSFILMLYREGYVGNILLFLVIAVIIAVITLIVSDANFMLPLLKIKMTGKSGIVLSLLILSGIFYVIIRRLVLKRNRKPLYKALIGSLIIAVVFVNGIEWGYSKLLQPHQKERIDLVLGKIDDPDGKGYNINRAKAAIGSGGFSGKGYLGATLANASQKHVPMQSTDFIFCTWSEEWGFLGSSFLIILYTIMLIRMIIIAERQRSRFTRIYAYSLAGIIFYHFMINVGMTIGLAPVIGIPLPFFSYGGSSIMAFSIGLFILLKLDAERKTVLQ